MGKSYSYILVMLTDVYENFAYLIKLCWRGRVVGQWLLIDIESYSIGKCDFNIYHIL